LNTERDDKVNNNSVARLGKLFGSVRLTFVQKAAGCVSSALYREVGGSGFLILEEWESEQDCDRYRQL
jgi:quinol monooxygenase YgiN